ncbi:MAG: PAS domain-containing protein, partial [Terriglobales bacterium]
MWSALRQAISNQAESLLRWLTASAIRSTAIFVILTFVPILLLTYYIVATSIRNTKAAAAGADAQVSSFAVTLLRADFRGEREALAGASDESSLERVLSGSLAPQSRYPRSRGRQQAALRAATMRAAGSLARLRARRSEFMAIALYRADGALLASAPASSGAVPQFAPPLPPPAVSLPPPPGEKTAPSPGANKSRPTAPPPALVPRLPTAKLPAWFRTARAGGNVVSILLPATAHVPARLAFAAPVTFTLPAHAPVGAVPTGVLAGFLPVAVVSDWVDHINTGPDRMLYVVDRAHQVVSQPALSPFPPSVIGQLAGVQRALAGASGSGDYLTAIHLETHAITYAPLPAEHMALLVVRPVRFSFYIYRVFYDKLALIAVIIFLLAVATGMLLRSAFRYYQRYNREVESGRAKTEALLGSMGDGVFAVDRDGRIIEFNRAAAALTGESAAESLHRVYSDVIHLHEEHPGQLPVRPDPVRQAMAQGRTFRFLRDLSLLRRDGTRLPITFTAAPVRDEEGGVQGCI